MVSHKPFTQLSVLLFIFSCLLSLNAPLAFSRAIESKSGKLDSELQEIIQISTGDKIGMEVVNLHGRIDIETEDYPVMSANNRHIPRNPGTGRP